MYITLFIIVLIVGLALAYLTKELLKLGPVGILAGITLVFENPATAAFQLILAEINLALNADTVLAVYGLSCINYIFSDIHVGLLSCGMELPTYKYIRQSDFNWCRTGQILREGNHSEGNERPDYQAVG